MMNNEQRWQAVIDRDQHQDSGFVYAVKTTGIYCRPSCPSRRPFRDNVEFFETGSAAESAGYRPCQRCHPQFNERVEPQVGLIVEICRYLEGDLDRLPTLTELGERFAISPYHLQRTFKRVIGVSPRRYADTHRRERLKARLKGGPSVTEALYSAGYGASSRFYQDSNAALGMTPIHYRKGGIMSTITYTIRPCELGYILVAATDKGICKISLGDNESELDRELRKEFPNSTIILDDPGLAAWVSVVLETQHGSRAVLNLPLDIQATGFQRRVWEALRSIPSGETRSYSAVASMLGEPTASRAVAQACATNPIALAIPCHRVVGKDGRLSGYRWGVERKARLLQNEEVSLERV